MLVEEDGIAVRVGDHQACWAGRLLVGRQQLPVEATPPDLFGQRSRGWPRNWTMEKPIIHGPPLFETGISFNLSPPLPVIRRIR